jgi:hypothetical protein
MKRQQRAAFIAASKIDVVAIGHKRYYAGTKAGRSSRIRWTDTETSDCF